MITTRQIDPAEDAVQTFIRALDDYQNELYPQESNHLDPVSKLTSPNVYFIGAFSESKLIGIGAIKLLDLDGGYGEIKRVFVCQSGRGMGVSEVIMKDLERHAVNNNINVIRLETGIHQLAAIGLYEKMNYTRCGPFGDYPDDRFSVFMEKILD